MSIRTLVKYGNRLYAKTTYATNLDAESLVITLTDSTTLSDTRVDTVAQILSDLLTLIDTQGLTASKPLADSITLSDAFLITAFFERDFFETLSISDAKLLTNSTKALTEFIVLHDWLTINLIKANIWTSTSASLPKTRTFSLYGKCLYAKANYGSSRIINWDNPGTPTFLPASGWTNQDGTEPVN